ncbi:hypothetical protein EV363DRAFT_822396 [Boletus edulis]|nr:hypothetical protein EV363DRAFT_822396 [Boletus edulis]
MYRLSVKLLRCGLFISFRSSLIFLIFTAALSCSYAQCLRGVGCFFHRFEVALLFLSLTFYFILKGVVRSQRREKRFVARVAPNPLERWEWLQRTSNLRNSMALVHRPHHDFPLSPSTLLFCLY